MRAVIYTRASLDRTGEGKSNERQFEECQRLVEFKRWETVAHEADVSISAYGEKDRPAWKRVLAMVESGDADVVVAWHLDRLTRNMADLEKLILVCEKHNVLVATATGDIDLTNDTGRMVARILAAVARQEVERKAARQRLAHVQRRSEGRPWAGVKMLGYERDGSIIDQEASAIRQAMKDVIEKRATLAEIGRRWHDLGLASPYKDAEKPWTAAGVKRVLTNPRLAGLITATRVENGQRIREVLGEGQWEAIVPETTLTVVTAMLSDPDRVRGTVKTGPKAANLLTGIMACSKCGATVRAGTKRGVRSYMCPEYHAQVNRDDADHLVQSSFAAALAMSAPGAILPTSLDVVDLEGVMVEVGHLRERQNMLARSYARGITTETAYDEAATELHEQIAVLEASLTGAVNEVEWQRIRAQSVKEFLALSFEDQRFVLAKRAVVTLSPGMRGRAGAKRQIEVQVRSKRGSDEVKVRSKSGVSEVLIPAFVPGVSTGR